MPFNVVLLLVFNYAAHVRLNLPRLRELYEPHFSSIVVYADVPRSPSDAIAGVTYVDIREGLFVHRALADFARTHAANVSRASGAFMVMDDAIINVRALPSGGGGAPWWDGVVFNTDERALRAGGYLSHANGSLPRVTPPERRREWTWDYSPTGNAAIAALRARRGPAAFDDAFCAAFSDYLYMPARMWSPAFADDCAALADVGLSLEIAVPTALRAALLREAAPPRLLAFDAVTLWNDGWRIDRDLVRRGDFLWRALCGGDDGVGDGDRDVGAAPHVPRVLAVHPVKISNDRTWARLRYAAARAAAAGDAAGYAPCPPWPPSAAADAWMLGDDSAGDSWGAFVRVRAGDAGAWAARHPVWAVVLAAGPLVLLLARQARGGGGGWLWCGRSGACSTVAHARRVARIVHVSWAAWAGPRVL